MLAVRHLVPVLFLVAFAPGLAAPAEPAPPTPAPAAPDPARMAAMLQALQKPQRVVAKFEQTKTIAAFTTPQVARGELYVSKPDKLRWAYEAPYRMVLVQRGDRVSMSYPDMGRKQSFDLAKDPQMKAVFDTILFFQQADPETVAKRFSATLVGEGHLQLVPREPGAAKLLSRIEVRVDPALGVLTHIVLAEPDGDRTELRFYDLKVDVPIDDALLQP